MNKSQKLKPEDRPMAVAAPPVQTVTVTRTINTPAANIYRSFTDRDWITDWFADGAEVRAAVGGHAFFNWTTGYYAIGQFTTLTPSEQVGFTWRGVGETTDTQIDVTIREESGVSGLTVTLSGVNPDAASEVRREWETRLDNLVSVQETGANRRITDRVIIGIFPGAVTEADAAQYGIEPGGFSKVNNVIPGYSAESAGILAGDIILEAEGQPVTNDRPIGVILAGRKPGDTATVIYGRGGERHTAQITLKGYPIPALAADFNALADSLEAYYTRFNGEIEAVFAGINEAAASHHPKGVSAPESGESNEWNAKQVLAHLILNERYLHNMIGGYLQGPEPSGYPNNNSARINAIVSTFGSAQALISELRRARAETVATLRGLPATFDRQRSALWWLNFEFNGPHQHDEEHFAQIQAALAEATA
jgi:uncharacterized protein YndB with AHSA1/START domain